MMLRRKFKLPEKANRAVPGRLGCILTGLENKDDDCGGLGEGIESGEELETFLSLGFPAENKCHSDENLRISQKFDRGTQIRSPASANAVDDEKRSDLEFELSQPVINLEKLQRIASSGLPDGGGLRANAWKLLLGYLPASHHLWERELAENRSKYATLKKEQLVNPSEFTSRKDDASVLSEHDGSVVTGQLRRHEISHEDHPLSIGKACVWHQYFQDSEIVEQIDRDLQRTHPDLPFFSGESLFSRKNREAMRNILILFAKLNPAIRYVQGMNEVLAPLYFVFSTDPDEKDAFNVEADTFGCFVRLLSDSIDHFCPHLDNSSVGIHSTLSRLSEILKANDEQLWRHLEVTNKVNPQFYAFRWITLLLTQEFNFHSIMRIWDSLLSNPFGVQDMLLRICCAMLLCVRSWLLSGDFTANLKLLQHYPEINIEHLLQVAQSLCPDTSSSFLLPL